MTAQLAAQAAADRAASDPAALVPTPTPTADHVTAREITEFLRHRAELRVGARSHDPAERAAFLHRKAELFTRVANQHAAARPILPTTHEGRTP